MHHSGTETASKRRLSQTALHLMSESPRRYGLPSNDDGSAPPAEGRSGVLGALILPSGWEGSATVKSDP